MKKITLIALLVAALFARPLATSAHADDDAAWAIAGFVGGVIAEKAVQKHKSNRHHQYNYNRHNGHTTTVHGNSCGSTRVIIRENGGHYGHDRHAHPSNCGCNSCKPSGYYKYETRKIWIPGTWQVTYDRCGNRTRTWCPGYYQTKQVRVWVSTGGYHHNDYSYNRF